MPLICSDRSPPSLDFHYEAGLTPDDSASICGFPSSLVLSLASTAASRHLRSLTEFDASLPDSTQAFFLLLASCEIDRLSLVGAELLRARISRSDRDAQFFRMDIRLALVDPDLLLEKARARSAALWGDSTIQTLEEACFEWMVASNWRSYSPADESFFIFSGPSLEDISTVTPEQFKAAQEAFFLRQESRASALPRSRLSL